MTDFKEQAERLVRSLGPYWFERQDVAATALSDAYEAGRREEREACAQVADSERAVWGGDFSIAAFSARKAAEDIASAIRSREANHDH